MEVRILELTAPGSGGVSVLNLAGAQALSLVAEWGLLEPVVGQLSLTRLAVGGEAYDEALVCVLAEDRVEVHVHGSPPLVRALLRFQSDELAHANSAGIEARADALLARASSELAARVLLDQVEGALRREFELMAQVKSADRDSRIRKLLQDSQSLRFLFEPARVLLAGPVNAGKSTLFNLLVGGDRVITSSEAGTTRDLIEEPAVLDGWPVFLLDSAGLRDLSPSDPRTEVERAGQCSASRARNVADLVIWLRPPGAGEAPSSPPGVVLRELFSLADLPLGRADGISVVSRPEEALYRVEQLFREALLIPDLAWIPGRPIAFDPNLRADVESWIGLDAGDAVRRINATLHPER